MTYLSVVMPVKNEAMHINNTLLDIVQQNYSRNSYEIIIVDGMSTDDTIEVANKLLSEFPGVNYKILQNKGELSSCGRNIGIKASNGKYIAVIDGHVHIPTKELFSAIEISFEKHKAICLARPAPLDVPGINSGTAFWIALARKSRLGHSKNSYIYSDYDGFVDPMSSGFAYKKELFETIGYFDETFDAAEDVEFHYRLHKEGIQAYTAPGLLIYYYPRSSYKSLFYQQTRYGIGRNRFLNKHKDAFTVETLIPPAIFIYFTLLALIVLLLRNNVLTIIYIIGISIYIIPVLISSIHEASKSHSIKGVLPISFAIWVTHMGLGYGYLKSFIKNKLEKWRLYSKSY